ncbi:hypothetical protein [Swingsia samuiensis]|uniref:Uncharacterized protein n=1 Tax=Swingsia samuiensis TaxID=1293412 RepID=A0A4Y6ULE0_9PROT|nr:hypothetical protein [Swingsia samuiensis]QDH17276.1 hypothetical protein E3D00_06675 [Swingsia samuiensis]
MMIPQILPRSSLAVIALAFSAMTFSSHTATAASHHSKGHHRHSRYSAGNENGPAPVILSAHPGTKLDADARKLSADDLADAAKHHDHPAVLVGSAPLSSKKSDEALFVQLQSAGMCGSAGCTTSVYLWHNNNWVTALDGINGDISVLPTKHKGMKDLLVGRNDRWIWNGHEYQDTLNAPPVPKSH